MKLPFAMSPEAEAYLCERLQSDTVEGMEPALTAVRGFTVRDNSGEIVERFDHEQFILGYSGPSKHIGFSRFELAGFPLLIDPHTIEKLKGKLLSVEPLARLDHPERARDILVALPLDEARHEI